MGKSRRNNFLVQGSILAAASIISRLIGLVYRVPMTNIIGDEGIGYYNVAYSIYNIALILSSYSLPLAVSRLVAAKCVNKEYKSSYRIFIHALIFGAVSGLIMALIIFFGADFFAETFFESPKSALPLRILSPTIFLCAIMGVIRGYFQGKKTMIPTSVSQIVEQIINAIVSVVAAYSFMMAHSASAQIASYGAAGGTLGTTCGAIAGFAFLIFVFLLNKPLINKQIARDKSTSDETSMDLFKIIFLTSFPIVLSQTVYQISGIIDNSIFGKIMAMKGYTEEARNSLLGIYSGKYLLLTNVPVAIASALGTSMVPSIVAAKEKGYMYQIRHKVAATIKFNMLITIPSAVGLAVFAPYIMQLLFPSASIDSTRMASNLMMIGASAVVFYAMSTISNAVLQGIGRMNVPVIHSLISLGIHVVVVVIMLLCDMGVYALVAGNIIFPIGVTILNWFTIKKETSYEQEIYKTYIIPFLSAAIMGIISILSYQLIYKLTDRNSVSCIFGIIIAVLVYFVSLILLKGVTEEELYKIPKGASIVRFLRKLRLI